MTSVWGGASEKTSDRLYPVFCQTIITVEKLLSLRPDPQRPDLKGDHGQGSLWCLAGRGSGIIMALYVVATKCRDSVVRRKALALLKTLNMQEGILSTNLVSTCLDEMVDLEERKARNIAGIAEDVPLRCEDVLEEARFLDVTINAGRSDVGMMCLITSVREPGWPGFSVEPEHWFSSRKT